MKVIQRNYNNNTLDFDKEWAQYKEGFGNLFEDFWFGKFVVKKGIKNDVFLLLIS